MKTKYDWSKVPKHINWIATDDDGVAHGFCSEPIIGKSGLWFFNGDYEQYTDLDMSLYDLFDKNNWQDSLEQRP